VLYGKLDATNSEVNEACTLAMCNEFINSKELLPYDDTAQSILHEMEKQKVLLEEMIGVEKYKEEIEVLNKLKV